MKLRLWYPQLDVYDAVRRLVCLLGRWTIDPPSSERLYIADFYFANPPLMHRVHFAQERRRQFTALGVPRPENTFLSYPSAPILFHTMGHIQQDAFKTLVGKGLIDTDQLGRSEVQLSRQGTKLFEERISALLTENERPILDFIVNTFGSSQAGDIVQLRKRTGLRRIAA